MHNPLNSSIRACALYIVLIYSTFNSTFNSTGIKEKTKNKKEKSLHSFKNYLRMGVSVLLRRGPRSIAPAGVGIRLKIGLEY